MSEVIDIPRLRRIEAALLELPNLDRQIFLARRLDGMTVEEIAMRTRLSRRLVEKRLLRAICHLGKRLRDLDEE